MHPLLREAEFQFRLTLESYSDPARVPPLADISIHRNEYRADVRFTTRLADGRQIRWACDDRTFAMVPPIWRSARRLIHTLRELWDEMRSERREPPRMITPPTDEALRDELVNPPGFIEYVEYGERRPSWHRRPQTTYRGVMGRCGCPACNPITAKAISKSVALLREWLSPAQLAQYDKGKYFDVTGSAGKRYLIKNGIQNNILEYDESGTKATAVLCFGPQGACGSLPGDAMLAQKIMLENDEPGALKVANVTRFTFPGTISQLL
jgi:hypothetical protein